MNKSIKNTTLAIKRPGRKMSDVNINKKITRVSKLIGITALAGGYNNYRSNQGLKHLQVSSIRRYASGSSETAEYKIPTMFKDFIQILG